MTRASSPPVSLPPAVRLHQLEGFFYVATEQGYTRAAQAMPYAITEPALHQQVSKLEKALELKLLERGPRRRMILTPEGRALYRFVCPYFQQLPAVLRNLTGGQGGELVIGTEPLYVEGLCAPLLARLRKRFPDARLLLRELDLNDLLQRTLTGQLDIAIASVSEVPPGLAYRKLGTLGLELLVPGKHPLAKRRPPLQPDHFKGHGFVVYEPGTLGRAFTEVILAKLGIRLEVAAETSSAAAMRALTRAGVGPAFLPALGRERPMRKKGADGTVAFDLTGVVREVSDLPPFGLLQRETQTPSLLLREFVTACRQEIN